jgi:maltose alpha-D-glucosyltransferase/alpha-amylase
MIPTLEVAGGWESVFEGAARAALERGVLANYLRAQRWFGGKGRRIEGEHVVVWGDFPVGAKPSYLVLLQVTFTSSETELYFLPVGVTEGTDVSRLQRSMPSALIARLKGTRGEALLHDLLADDAACTGLQEAIGSGRDFSLGQARVCGIPTAAFTQLRGGAGELLCIERAAATSSNSLVYYGPRLLLKLFRRLEAGTNPDYEIGRFLTEETTFDHLPRVAGTLECRRLGSPPITLAILQERIANQGDGWTHALDELGHFYQRCSGQPLIAPDERPLLELANSPPPTEALETIGNYLHAAETLGRRSAEMHLALASKPDTPDFAPEPFTARDTAALNASIHEQARRALSALRENVERMPDDAQHLARQLLDAGPCALEELGQPSRFHTDADRIRCHGDYHLGQVLRVENDYYILDFEGEPARPIEERRAKQSPLKDLAGMLRSYHYVAHAGLFAFARDCPEDICRLEPRAELWFQWVAAAFLRAYRWTANGASFLPKHPAPFAALLDAFMLEKAFYELNYELNNRPDWVRTPLRGILTLLS